MRGGVFVAVVLGVWLAVGLAWAGPKERQAAHERKIVAPLEAKDPEAAAWFREADVADEAGDTPRALSLYEKVNEREPSFTPAIRRRGAELLRLGKRAEGIALMRNAVALEDTADNRLALAYALVTHPQGQPLDHADATEALGLARRNASEAPNDIDQQLALCHVAARAESASDIGTCSARCVQLAPNEPEPYIFATIAAIDVRGDRDEAEAWIAKGRANGLDAATADRLEKMLDATESPLRHWGKRLLAVVAVWLAGMGILWGLGAVFSKRTLKLSKQMARSQDEHPGSTSMRRTYRALLQVAGAYYYASLPLVLLLSILTGAGVILGFLYIGRVPVYLFAITLAIVAFTIKSVIKGLVIRSRDEDPGLAVDLEKHHKLAKVIREVAERVGTRPVDEVYLTPKANIAVFERGGAWRQLSGKTERCLLLGVGVLEGMPLQPFKAVLAHEYGHFTNRDTAGGGLALGVRRSLLHTAMGLIQGGAAVWYNPAWLFVVSFQKIFLRISQGASRLQEVMADRVAAAAYGPESFAKGLTHVIRRSVELDAHIVATLREVVEGAHPLPNLYRYEPKEKTANEDIEAEVQKLLDQEPSDYDSHPKPADRIRWVRKLKSSLAPSPIEADDAWSLFEGRETVEQRLTDEVRANLAERGIRVMAEADVASAA